MQTIDPETDVGRAPIRRRPDARLYPAGLLAAGLQPPNAGQR